MISSLGNVFKFHPLHHHIGNYRGLSKRCLLVLMVSILCFRKIFAPSKSVINWKRCSTKVYCRAILKKYFKKKEALLSNMRWMRLIVGELLVLFASILVFRSAWTLLDEYLGKSNLWIMLITGIILTIIALVLLDHEVKCELEKKKQT